MKLSLRLASKNKARSKYARSLAARVEPGEYVRFANGVRRVVQKSAMANGVRMVLASRSGSHTVDLKQFAALGPVSPAMSRLASFVHHILSFDAALDQYVKEAIKAADLPVDHSINWAKYLDKLYMPFLRSITKDETLIDDGIRDMVVDELYRKRILSPDSKYAHFTEQSMDYTDHELELKVTAFLKSTFKFRKSSVVDYVKRSIGIGADGELGLAPSLGIENENEEENPDLMMDVEDPSSRSDLDEMEGSEEIHEFLKSFTDYIDRHVRSNSAKALTYITESYEAGMTKKDIKHALVGNPAFSGRNGEPLTVDGYNFVMTMWGRLLKEFVEDPAEGWKNSPLGRMIVYETKSLTNAKPQRVAAASLHLAEVVTPAKNPNVQQQDALAQKNEAQPASSQRKTITPEIPGVNHTSPENTMSKLTRSTSTKPYNTLASALRVRKAAAAKATSKFAKLRRIAEEKPEAVGDSLSYLADVTRKAVDQLENIKKNLDLDSDEERRDKKAGLRHASRFSSSRFAASLKRIAEDKPEEIEDALNEVYSTIDHVADTIETLADNLDINLDEPEQVDEIDVTEE